LRYTFFHFLSASSIVLKVPKTPLFYYSWRHFSLDKYCLHA
jgi:hypothetical protein